MVNVSVPSDALCLSEVHKLNCDEQTYRDHICEQKNPSAEHLEELNWLVGQMQVVRHVG